MTIYEDFDFWAMYRIVIFVQILFGIQIAYRNLFIFSLLRNKPKKTATEYLILCNLFSDGLFGVQLIVSVLIIGVCNEEDSRKSVQKKWRLKTGYHK